MLVEEEEEEGAIRNCAFGGGGDEITSNAQESGVLNQTVVDIVW